MLAIILVLRDLSKEERIFPIPSFVMLLACSAPCPPPEFCEQFKKINFGIVQFTITFSFFGPFPASLHCFCAGSYQSVLKKYSTKAIVMWLHQSLFSYSILSVRTSDLKHTDLKCPYMFLKTVQCTIPSNCEVFEVCYQSAHVHRCGRSKKRHKK